MHFWEKTPEQKREEYKRMNTEIRIVDYATMLGFHLEKKGRYFSLHEHDSVMIDADRNIFVRNSVFDRGRKGHAGSTIDFALEFSGKSKAEVLRELSEMLDINRMEIEDYSSSTQGEKVKEKKNVQAGGIELPIRDNNIKNVYAYLVATRKINKEIVNEWIQKKWLYQDKRKNCVFVSYDSNGKPIYGFLRGTNTRIPFKGDLKGCNYEQCFYVDNKANKTVVTESVIDGLSYMTILKDQNVDYHKYNFLMLGSANKYMSVFYHMEHDSAQSYILALDSDATGNMFTDKIMEQGYKLRPDINLVRNQSKFMHDWNEELCFIKQEKIRADYFLPDQQQTAALLSYFVAKKNVVSCKYDDIPAVRLIMEIAEKQLKESKIPDAIKQHMDHTVDVYLKHKYQFNKLSEGKYIGYSIDCYNRKKFDMGILQSIRSRQEQKER